MTVTIIRMKTRIGKKHFSFDSITNDFPTHQLAFSFPTLISLLCVTICIKMFDKVKVSNFEKVKRVVVLDDL